MMNATNFIRSRLYSLNAAAMLLDTMDGGRLTLTFVPGASPMGYERETSLYAAVSCLRVSATTRVI